MARVKVLTRDEINTLEVSSAFPTVEERGNLIHTFRYHTAKFSRLEIAARDFLHAFRAHLVFDRTEEFNVTANRLIETRDRLAELLGEENADGTADLTTSTQRERGLQKHSDQ